MSAASPALSANRPPRVLITGLQGFTGRHMAVELEQNGYEVWGIGDTSPDEPRTLKADLTDLVSLKTAIQTIQPHYVIHLAGIAFVGHGQPQAFYDINLVGTRNLLEALKPVAENLKCVLLASTAHVYGNRHGGLYSETTPVSPPNDYAVSKLGMEYMAQLWLPHIPVVIARPFNYTGVGQTDHFLIPKIVSHFVRQQTTIELGNMDVWREFNDVRDVVYAYRRLIEAAPIGQTVNVCSSNLFSLRDALSITSALTGHTLNVVVNPAFVRANEVLKLGGDSSLLKTFIPDWKPRQLNETIAWMIASGFYLTQAT